MSLSSMIIYVPVMNKILHKYGLAVPLICVLPSLLRRSFLGISGKIGEREIKRERRLEREKASAR